MRRPASMNGQRWRCAPPARAPARARGAAARVAGLVVGDRASTRALDGADRVNATRAAWTVSSDLDRVRRLARGRARDAPRSVPPRATARRATGASAPPRPRGRPDSTSSRARIAASARRSCRGAAPRCRCTASKSSSARRRSRGAPARGVHARVEVGDHEVELAAAHRGGGSAVARSRCSAASPGAGRRTRRSASAACAHAVCGMLRPAALLGERERLARACAGSSAGPCVHHVEQREVAQRRDRDEVEPVGARERDGPAAAPRAARSSGAPTAPSRPSMACTSAWRASSGRRRGRPPRPAAASAASQRARRSRPPGAPRYEAGERHRLQVAAAARLGQRRRPRSACARCARAASVSPTSSAAQASAAASSASCSSRSGGAASTQPADRGGLAAHEEVEPVLGDDLDREVPVLRLDRVPERVRPAPRAAYQRAARRVQVRQLAAELALGARAQELGEQAVVAEPLAVAVHAEDEPVGALERRRACPRPWLSPVSASARLPQMRSTSDVRRRNARSRGGWRSSTSASR